MHSPHKAPAMLLAPMPITASPELSARDPSPGLLNDQPSATKPEPAVSAPEGVSVLLEQERIAFLIAIFDKIEGKDEEGALALVSENATSR